MLHAQVIMIDPDAPDPGNPTGREWFVREMVNGAVCDDQICKTGEDQDLYREARNKLI